MVYGRGRFLAGGIEGTLVAGVRKKSLTEGYAGGLFDGQFMGVQGRMFVFNYTSTAFTEKGAGNFSLCLGGNLEGLLLRGGKKKTSRRRASEGTDMTKRGEHVLLWFCCWGEPGASRNAN